MLIPFVSPHQFLRLSIVTFTSLSVAMYGLSHRVIGQPIPWIGPMMGSASFHTSSNWGFGVVPGPHAYPSLFVYWEPQRRFF
jgi:hypothetical protein